MKAIKIIIVTVIVAALGFGIFKIVQNKPETPEIVEIDIPEGCEGVVSSAQQLIETRFNAVMDGEFNKLKSIPEDLRMFFVGQNIESECMVSVNAIIRNRHLVRFIAMAKSEFGKKSWNWNNFESIESMNNEFLKEEKDNADLKEFKRICEEYRAVAVYNSKVRNQSKQLPSSINSRWDYDKTKSIVDKQPTATKPVNTTTLYDNTRKGAVQKSLHEGHVAFIDALMEKARENIKANPTEENYRKVINTVSDNSSEIALYQNKAKSMYNVSASMVDSNVNRWNGLLTSFHKIVEENILNLGVGANE